MQNLSYFGKITISKTLVLSKLVHLTLVTNVPTTTIEMLSKILKKFLWGKRSLRLNMTTYVMVAKMQY